MKDKVISFIKNPLVGGSSVVFIGTFAGNIVNYIFNLIMGRLLTVSDYGLLVSLNSLLILVGIFSVSFVTIITKFSARYHSTNSKIGAYTLLTHGARFIFTFSVILLAVLILLIGPIASFLKITNYSYIFLIELSIFFSLIMSLPVGFIQGTLRFYLLSIITLIQPVIRLVVAVVLLIVGYKLLGPLVGLLLSALLPAIILSIYLFRKYRVKAEDSTFDTQGFKKDFFHYTYTYFLSGIGLTLLSNTDILLVRHFFNPETAGQYAALSLMGKAILYFTTPINTVFFPVIAYKKERNEKLFKTVLLATSAVVILSAGLSLVYFVAPQIILRIFFPKPGYHVLTNYLGYYSLYILIFSAASLLNSYFLSIGRTKVYFITLLGAAVQIGSIILFHSSIYQVIAGLFTASLVMLLLLVIYYKIHGEN